MAIQATPLFYISRSCLSNGVMKSLPYWMRLGLPAEGGETEWLALLKGLHSGEMQAAF